MSKKNGNEKPPRNKEIKPFNLSERVALLQYGMGVNFLVKLKNYHASQKVVK